MLLNSNVETSKIFFISLCNIAMGEDVYITSQFDVFVILLFDILLLLYDNKTRGWFFIYK
jgi:hypothetical protein